MGEDVKLSLSKMREVALQFHNLITIILKDIIKLDIEIHPGVKHIDEAGVDKWILDRTDTSLMTFYAYENGIITSDSYSGLNSFIDELWEILFTNCDYLDFKSEVIELVRVYSNYSLEDLSLFLKMKGLNMEYFEE